MGCPWVYGGVIVFIADSLAVSRGWIKFAVHPRHSLLWKCPGNWHAVYQYDRVIDSHCPPDRAEHLRMPGTDPQSRPRDPEDLSKDGLLLGLERDENGSPVVGRISLLRSKPRKPLKWCRRQDCMYCNNSSIAAAMDRLSGWPINQRVLPRSWQLRAGRSSPMVSLKSQKD